MNLAHDIRPVTYLKNKAADLLLQINTTHRPVVITQNGEAKGVLQDPESYEQMKAAIGLLKLVAQGEKDIQVGHTAKAADVFARAKKKLSTPRV
ncbi:MAG TPA: type II toxin-antitoxin system Phd/YefM family antitoxin [Kiritimatiellia bacterium]|nr:type II toxin-antitoxin system Phd/YefM family antitoxin [Kiritimatiellia bacterium]HMP34517.1 type II toxin-antitoxin system Phd/YefM family antitoxin [Kiritimatiellia bacterium]